MILLRLFFEFAKTGLFAVGGGLATIPFLRDIGLRTNWFTEADLTKLIPTAEGVTFRLDTENNAICVSAG